VTDSLSNNISNTKWSVLECLPSFTASMAFTLEYPLDFLPPSAHLAPFCSLLDVQQVLVYVCSHCQIMIFHSLSTASAIIVSNYIDFLPLSAPLSLFRSLPDIQQVLVYVTPTGRSLYSIVRALPVIIVSKYTSSIYTSYISYHFVKVQQHYSCSTRSISPQRVRIYQSCKESPNIVREMSGMRARRVSMTRKGCGAHVIAITCCGRPPVSQLVLIYASRCT
jgi:hypothetical protein